MDTRFYVVQYQPGAEGCPHFLSGEVNRDEWEWPMYVTDPFSVPIEHEYVYRVENDEVSVNFDFYGSQTNFVSEKFLTVCDELRVSYRAVPLRITQGRRSPSKNYSIFLPGTHFSLINRQQSEFAEDQDLETGAPAMNALFPNAPVYKWIKKFVPRQDCTAHFFRCVEIMELVCTEAFKVVAEGKQLKGIAFIPIDDSYRYDPWDEAE